MITGAWASQRCVRVGAGGCLGFPLRQGRLVNPSSTLYAGLCKGDAVHRWHGPRRHAVCAGDFVWTRCGWDLDRLSLHFWCLCPKILNHQEKVDATSRVPRALTRPQIPRIARRRCWTWPRNPACSAYPWEALWPWPSLRSMETPSTVSLWLLAALAARTLRCRHLSFRMSSSTPPLRPSSCATSLFPSTSQKVGDDCWLFLKGQRCKGQWKLHRSLHKACHNPGPSHPSRPVFRPAGGLRIPVHNRRGRSIAAE